MALGKILDLGGIDNSSPKANQAVGGFRVARNVMPTPDNTLIPRYDWTTPGGQPNDIRAVSHIANYDNLPLVLMGEDVYSSGAASECATLYYNNTRVPTWISPPEYWQTYTYTSQLPQSIRTKNTTYFLIPGAVASLMKYDGVEFGLAGCRPVGFEVATADLSGTRYIRSVTHTVDFDENEPVSSWMQFNSGASGTLEIFMNGAAPAGYTEVPGSSTSPNSLQINIWSGENYFEGTAAFDAANDRFTITTTATNITLDSKVGSYVFVAGTRAEMVTMGFSATDNFHGLALRVKSVSGGLYLDQAGAKVRKLESGILSWRDESISDARAATIAAAIRYGTRYYVSLWEAPSATGTYVFRGMFPSYTGTLATLVAPHYRSITIGTTTPTAGYDQTMFTIDDTLNEWYDVDSIKLSPNAYFPFQGYNGGVPLYKFHAMAKYNDALLFATEDYIWYSDTTFGGWIEQLNAFNSLLVGDREYGRIVAIAATNDFIFVGRERKNYIITGNLSTRNIVIQEVEEAEIGPWCNNSAISIKESVYFLTAVGVYQVTGGGRCVKLSESLPKNFATYNANSINEDVAFRMTGTNSVLEATTLAERGLAVGYDEYRELLVWMKREEGNACLVLHTKTGRFYEWDGLGWGYEDMFAGCISFIQAEYYIGMEDIAFPYTLRAFYATEDNSVIRSYCTQYPIKLYTTWLTGGEPSLEKELLQLKMFGRIKASSTTPLLIKHYKDWDTSTLITNSTYYPISTAALNSQTQYSHKKRLNSDKFLAASVGVEMNDDDCDFELESLEVELNSIQNGMKR